MSTIFEVAMEWGENQFIALMTWIPGASLDGFKGVFPLLAEEQEESSSEALALRWLGVICEALNVLHRNSLIHGDVSPSNLIVSGSDLVLTDYDFVRHRPRDSCLDRGPTDDADFRNVTNCLVQPALCPCQRVCR